MYSWLNIPKPYARCQTVSFLCNVMRPLYLRTSGQICTSGIRYASSHPFSLSSQLAVDNAWHCWIASSACTVTCAKRLMTKLHGSILGLLICSGARTRYVVALWVLAHCAPSMCCTLVKIESWLGSYGLSLLGTSRTAGIGCKRKHYIRRLISCCKQGLQAKQTWAIELKAMLTLT